MNTEKKTPWFVYLLAAIVFVIVAFGDWLAENNLILPAAIAIVVIALGILLVQGLKEWKKSDEEILSAYDIWKSFQPKEGTGAKKTVLRALLGSGVLLFFLLKDHSIMPLPAKIVFGILAVVVALSPILSIKRKDSQKSSRTYRITGKEVTAFLAGLIPTLFFCFFIGLGTYHGVWWFVTPPGLVFLVLFTRPLVAAVRTVYRRFRPDDEAHIRKGKELDPWERPDTDPKKYRRK